MVLSRNYEDILGDYLLLLYLVSKGTKLGRTKLQKLGYLIECTLSKKQIKTFNYNFIRWDYGPFTKEILEDTESLVDNELITDYKTKLTEQGEEILELSKELFEHNKEIIGDMDQIIDRFDKLSLAEIKESVYNSKVEINGEMVRVEDIPHGTDLKTRISEEDSANKFDISDEWFETLDIFFDKEFKTSLDEACEDAKENKSHNFYEVFSDV